MYDNIESMGCFIWGTWRNASRSQAVMNPLIKHALIEHALIEHALIKHALIEHALIEHALIKHGAQLAEDQKFGDDAKPR